VRRGANSRGWPAPAKGCLGSDQEGRGKSNVGRTSRRPVGYIQQRRDYGITLFPQGHIRARGNDASLFNASSNASIKLIA
jgi:hypothetical protein